MGQFSMEISRHAGSVLSGNQHLGSRQRSHLSLSIKFAIELSVEKQALQCLKMELLQISAENFSFF